MTRSKIQIFNYRTLNLGEIQRDKIGLFLKGSSKKILQLYPKFGQFDKWFLMVKIAVAFLAIFEKMDYFLFPHLATLFRFNEKWETFFVQIWHFFVGIVHQGRRRVETPTSRQRGKRRRSGRSLSALCR